MNLDLSVFFQGVVNIILLLWDIGLAAIICTVVGGIIGNLVLRDKLGWMAGFAIGFLVYFAFGSEVAFNVF